MVRNTRPRAGSRVRVRSAEEILATLDEQGELDSLPFMPEMLKFCGQDLPVAARAHKTCDAAYHSGRRRMDNAVHLVGARCDGSAHGGCQANCLLFWREEWLERADEPGEPIVPVPAGKAAPATVDTLTAATQAEPEGEEPVYRCQTTRLLAATRPLRRREAWQYVEDLRSGNVSPLTLARGLAVQMFNKYQRFSLRWLPGWLRIGGGQPYPFLRGTGTGARTPTSGLVAGDLVEVKQKSEILPTISPQNMNRGMDFNPEMLPFCGKQYRVAYRVTRILDEKTGKMLKLGDCVVLDGVVCRGTYHDLCPRAIPPYWRDAWLQRIDSLPQQGSAVAERAAGGAAHLPAGMGQPPHSSSGTAEDR